MALSEYVGTTDRISDGMSNPFVGWNSTSRLFSNEAVDNISALEVLQAESAAKEGHLLVDRSAYYRNQEYQATAPPEETPTPPPKKPTPSEEEPTPPAEDETKDPEEETKDPEEEETPTPTKGAGRVTSWDPVDPDDVTDAGTEDTTDRNAPATGDDSRTELWLVMLLLASAAMIGIRKVR